MSTHRSLALAGALALVAASGCATKIAVYSMRPGPVNVGATNHLVILDGEGRRSAREYVYREFLNQCRARGYFTAADRSEDGVRVRVSGRRVALEGTAASTALESRHAGVRIDILEWVAYRDNNEVVRVDEEGAEYVEVVPVKCGAVLLAVTVFDDEGRAILVEREYRGVASTDDLEAPREEIIEYAGRRAVARLLHDLTPVSVVSYVRLDDDDEAQLPIIETAKAGGVAQAAADMRRYFETNPQNAAAAYNLAVFLEAMGEYAEALELYDQALRLGHKGFYVTARAGCARRLAAARALQPEDDEPEHSGETPPGWSPRDDEAWMRAE